MEFPKWGGCVGCHRYSSGDTCHWSALQDANSGYPERKDWNV